MPHRGLASDEATLATTDHVEHESGESSVNVHRSRLSSPTIALRHKKEECTNFAPNDLNIDLYFLLIKTKKKKKKKKKKKTTSTIFIPAPTKDEKKT